MTAAAPRRFAGLPAVSSARMRELERRAAAEFGLTALELMENAGRAVAKEACRLLAGYPGAPVVVACGRGNNGGDGLVAARELNAAGFAVRAFLIAPRSGAAYGPEVAANLARARKAGVEPLAVERDFSELERALSRSALAVDAVLGIGAKGPLTGPALGMVERLAEGHSPVIAVDLPSGLDADTGEARGPAVTAEETLTLGLPKLGLLAPGAARFAGKIEVLDIGLPQELIASAEEPS